MSALSLAAAGLSVALLTGCGGPVPSVEQAPERPPLQAIVHPEPIAFLPRRGEPVTRDREVIQGLSDRFEPGLETRTMRNPARMIDALRAGEADLIVAGLAVTASRRERVAFSLPYLHVDELVVAPAREWPGTFEGVEVCVRRDSGPSESLAELAATRPEMAIRELAGDLRAERLMLLVTLGACDAAAIDSATWSGVSRDHPQLEPVHTLREDRPVAVAVHPDDHELRRRVDAFLTQEALTGRGEEFAVADLPAIEARQTLRMLTRNNSMTYFVHRGRQLGFEYELLRRFAFDRGLRLEIVIPPSHRDLIPWLQQGRGDVIAAAMSVTPGRDREVAFTRPYLEVDEQVVVRPDTPVERLADLAGRTVHVRRSSAFYPRLAALQADTDFEIELAPEDMETEEILARVEAGAWEVAVADSNLLQAERRLGGEGMQLETPFSLGTGRLAWGVRESNPELLAALDRYLEDQRGSRFFNVLRRKYFQNRRMLERGRDDWRSDRSGRISPWDDAIRAAAAEQSLDWRLVAAVMYRESRFDPTIRSWAGAVGLMQLMPATARSLGVSDLRDPEASIRGGTVYLRRLVDRFEPGLALASRLRFALAAYNVGYEHVRDARRLASRMGWSPDHWKGNVARALVLLERPQYHREARYGYCRGSEAVAYVSEVEQLYRVYAEVVPRVPEGSGDPVREATLAVPPGERGAGENPSVGVGPGGPGDR